MRTVIAFTVVLGLGTSSARADVIPAGGVEPYAKPVSLEPAGNWHTRSLVGKGAVVDHRLGTAVPVVTRLHPVVGSVQRGHFANPLTGKSNYKSTVYNPVLGSFGTYKFRR